MNLVDLLAFVLVVAAIFAGYRAGATRQLGGLLGGTVGLVLAVAIIALAVEPLGRLEAVIRIIAIVVVISVLFVVGHRLGATAGDRLIPSEADGPLGTGNRVAGSLVAVCLTLVLIWLLGGIVSISSDRRVASLAEGSATLQALDRFAPAPSIVAQDLQSAILGGDGAQLLNGIGGIGTDPARLPSEARARAVATSAQPSVVKVLAAGCAWESTGSGAVIGSGYVVTNAHVVHGGHRVTVALFGNAFDAQVVAFDAQLDVAVLHVPGLPAPPLSFTHQEIRRGTAGVGLGYPGGGGFVASRASVNRTVPTYSHNVMNGETQVRDVIELHSRVAPGDSGGPFVLMDGTIGGLVFAQSPHYPRVGYALQPDQVAAIAEPAVGLVEPVAIDPC